MVTFNIKAALMMLGAVGVAVFFGLLVAGLLAWIEEKRGFLHAAAVGIVIAAIVAFTIGGFAK